VDDAKVGDEELARCASASDEEFIGVTQLLAAVEKARQPNGTPSSATAERDGRPWLVKVHSKVAKAIAKYC
jgi:hypothetical protein